MISTHLSTHGKFSIVQGSRQRYAHRCRWIRLYDPSIVIEDGSFQIGRPNPMPRASRAKRKAFLLRSAIPLPLSFTVTTISVAWSPSGLLGGQCDSRLGPAKGGFRSVGDRWAKPQSARFRRPTPLEGRSAASCRPRAVFFDALARWLDRSPDRRTNVDGFHHQLGRVREVIDLCDDLSSRSISSDRRNVLGEAEQTS